MKKYWHIFTMSLSRQLTYRLSFVLSRLQNLAWLLIFYSIWQSLSKTTGSFAGFTPEQLTLYVFAVHVLRAFIFGSQSTLVAEEISSGLFSSFLIKPLSYFWLTYFRELGDKVILTSSALIELVIINFFVKIPLSHFLNLKTILTTVFSLFVAHFLYACLTQLISLIAFWSNDAIGPRFLFNWIVEFTSGSFFPLRIVGGFFSIVLRALPFTYLIYTPVLIFLRVLSGAEALRAILFQLVWLAVAAALMLFAWRRGLKHYGGEGI